MATSSPLRDILGFEAGDFRVYCVHGYNKFSIEGFF
jgi:hypothetical protein